MEANVITINQALDQNVTVPSILNASSWHSRQAGRTKGDRSSYHHRTAESLLSVADRLEIILHSMWKGK